MATVEKLYQSFGILADAKEKAGEHQEEYSFILSATKGSPSEKRLASQFIARFFKYFPDLAGQAINALFDLCEDDDSMTRKQAVKDLPTLCKALPEHIAKIAEALTQLFQWEETSEISLVHSSLMTLLNLNAKETLKGIFSQIEAEDVDDQVRERAIKFLTLKIRTLPEEVFDKATEEYVWNECKKVLQDVTKDEFIDLMNILKGLKTMTTVQGRQQLVETVVELAELDEPFKATDPDMVDKFIQCVKQAIPLFSKNVHSKAFMVYMCDNVMPVLSDLTTGEDDMNIELEMLKVLAEVSEFCGDLENTETAVEKVYERLIGYMPLPSSDENEDVASGAEAPKLQFSHVECLLFVFHQLARKVPGFLSDASNAERLKDFQLRLQFFARGVQVYIKQLRTALQGKTGDDLKTEENKIKIMALKITSNINILVKDLFHNPPSYKSTITLSWKPLTSKATTVNQPNSAGQKRTPITFDSSDGATEKKVNKQSRAIYAPPGGKYSEKAGTYTNNEGRGRGGGGGRGGKGRGGRGRRGYNRF